MNELSMLDDLERLLTYCHGREKTRYDSQDQKTAYVLDEGRSHKEEEKNTIGCYVDW